MSNYQVINIYITEVTLCSKNQKFLKSDMLSKFFTKLFSKCIHVSLFLFEIQNIQGFRIPQASLKCWKKTFAVDITMYFNVKLFSVVKRGSF
jgi:hypothetical protein